jgi:iron complex outermembrane receptor protein
MQTPTKVNRSLALATALAGLVLSGAAAAQDTDNVYIEEIMVTATKRAGGISVQDAGVAITAFSESQIDAMFLRDLVAVGYSAPNVQLEDIGTARGTANFSIRGLGINSSIPSIDPTVGVFIDGMYLGLNAGVVFDTFDLEGLEVLRGPQGLLFGRNVTGGAVLMRTTRPGDSLSINAKAAVETGDNKIVSAVLSAPLGDTFGFKLAAYVNDDSGWFKNLATGEDHGEADTKVYRAALSWTPTDNFDMILRVEHGTAEGDGPASQNGGLFGTTNFDFAIDEVGFYDNEWNHAILEATWDVSFGDGQFTNILAWREYSSETLGDIDATPTFLFHAPATNDHDQISNELRYNGTFGDVYLTTGIFYFSQEVEYIEQRDLLYGIGAGVTLVGGGIQKQDTAAIFAQVDWSVSDLVTFNLGGRYTQEDKDAQIATITVPALIGTGCSLETGCLNYECPVGCLIDSRDWSSFSPKIGIQITPSDNTQLYGFWTKGFRSGGYNLRHTVLSDPNESFDQEEQSSFEIGVKHDFVNGLVRLNVAAFHNTIEDMQREVNLPGGAGAVIQLIKNTADATITGFEAELDAALTDSLFLQVSLGYVDGTYDEIRFDLNGDGVIDRKDYALELPRLAPWSYGAQLIYDKQLSFGRFIGTASGYRRDTAYYTDNNIGSLRAADMFGASLALTFMEDQLTLSVYGKNLKDESTIGGDTQLPFFPGSTFSPLNKGRIYGFEAQWRNN